MQTKCYFRQPIKITLFNTYCQRFWLKNEKIEKNIVQIQKLHENFKTKAANVIQSSGKRLLKLIYASLDVLDNQTNFNRNKEFE